MGWTIASDRITVDAGTTETLTNLLAETVSGMTSSDGGDHTAVYVPNRQLRVDGTLVIDQRVEMLILDWDDPGAQPGVEIRNNGTLTLGRAVTAADSALDTPGTSYGEGTALIVGADGPTCCSNGSIRVANGGTFEVFGAVVKTRGCIEWIDGCTVNIIDGVFMNTSPTETPPPNSSPSTRIRIFEGANVDVNGLITYGMQSDWSSTGGEAFARFERFLPRDTPTGAQVFSVNTGEDVLREWRSVPDYRASVECFCNSYRGRNDMRVINAEIGSATLLMSVQSAQDTGQRDDDTTTAAGSTDTVLKVASSTGFAASDPIIVGLGNDAQVRSIASISGNDITLDRALSEAPGSGVAVSNVTSHGGRVFHELRLEVVDDEGSAIEGCDWWMRDTDNGNRIATDSAGGTIDETDDRTYSGSTDAMGRSAVTEVLTGMWWRSDKVGGIPNPSGGEIVDVRGKTGVAGADLFDARLWSYAHLPATISDITLNGLQRRDVRWTLFDDPLITETDKSVVDAYTELDTAAKMYDSLKAFISDSYAGETETIATRVGTRLDFGARNVRFLASGTLREIDKDELTASDISMTAATGTLATAAGSFAHFRAGTTVAVSGFATAANNGTFTLESIAANARSIVLTRDSGAFADESAGASITVEDTEDTVNLVVGDEYDGHVRTTGFFRLGAGASITGSAQDANGKTIPVNGLPAGHRGVAAAWPVADGESDRTNIVTRANHLHRSDISLGSPGALLGVGAVLSSSGSDFRAFSAGVTVTVSGFATAANNGEFSVVAVNFDGTMSISRTSGTFVTEAAGADVVVEDKAATSIRLTLDVDTEYFLITDAVSHLRAAPVRFNTGVHDDLDTSLRRIQDAAGNDLIPDFDSLSADEKAEFALIGYDTAMDEILFSATSAIEEYSFRAVARAIETGQSSEAAMANEHICIIQTGSFSFEAGSMRRLARASGVDAQYVPDLSAFQVTRIGSSDLKDFVDYSRGAIIVNRGVPSISTVTGTTRADFHANMASVPDSTKQAFADALSTDRFETLLEAVSVVTGLNAIESLRLMVSIGGGRVAENGDDSTKLDIFSLVDDSLVATIPKFVGETRAAGASFPSD